MPPPRLAPHVGPLCRSGRGQLRCFFVTCRNARKLPRAFCPPPIPAAKIRLNRGARNNAAKGDDDETDCSEAASRHFQRRADDNGRFLGKRSEAARSAVDDP